MAVYSIQLKCLDLSVFLKTISCPASFSTAIGFVVLVSVIFCVLPTACVKGLFVLLAVLATVRVASFFVPLAVCPVPCTNGLFVLGVFFRDGYDLAGLAPGLTTILGSGMFIVVRQGFHLTATSAGL
jgi:hypothetical protein